MADKLYGDVVADSTSLSIEVVLRSSTDNTAVTGVPFNSVTAFYYRQGDAGPTTVTMTSLAAANSAFASGGWREISSANYPGRYRFDVPNAAVVAGADWVGIQLRVATAFNFDVHYRIQSAALFADHVLKRDMSLVEAVTPAPARSPLNAIRLLRNRWITTPTTITVKKEDDTTDAWIGSLTTTPGATPITGTDPN